MPIITEDSHQLKIVLEQLQISASTPEAKPDQLDVSIHANCPGTISVKVDVAKILTDVLDLVEIHDRLIGQGIF